MIYYDAFSATDRVRYTLLYPIVVRKYYVEELNRSLLRLVYYNVYTIQVRITVLQEVRSIISSKILLYTHAILCI